MPTLFQIKAQRDRLSVYEDHAAKWAHVHSEAARRAGVDLEVITADQLTMEVGPGRVPLVALEKEALDPRRHFFHTRVLTWPPYEPDVWKLMTLEPSLSAAGFFTTISSRDNLINNDKLNTFLESRGIEGPRVLPTIRIFTRQFERISKVVPPEHIEYPVFVKPASWGGGFGVNVAATEDELDSLLQLAGASESTMLIQPLLEGPLVDVRIYCFDGVPEAAMERRPAGGRRVANMSRGGNVARVEVPEELRAASAALASRVGTPYVCVDFLRSNGTYWFSEYEVDGGTNERFSDLIEKKYGAYVACFRRHVDRMNED